MFAKRSPAAKEVSKKLNVIIWIICLECQVSQLSPKTGLYYICRYFTHKERLVTSENLILDHIKESEFARLISRGRQSHLFEGLYDLSQYLFACYNSAPVTSCANRLVEAFQQISDVAYIDVDKSIFR